MSNQTTAGISVGIDSAQIVILKSRSQRFELSFIEEYKRAESDKIDTWFLKFLQSHSSLFTDRYKVISFALDHSMVFIHTFPMDATLTRDQQNEHLNWELSQLLPNFHPQEYISDMHILKVYANEKRNDVLSVTVKRALVYAIHNYIAKYGITLNVIDASQFAAEEALIQSYPEIKSRNCLLIGLSKSYSEFSYYVSGHLNEYENKQNTNIEYIIQYIQVNIKEKDIDCIFLHGCQIDVNVLMTIRNAIPCEVQILNPFNSLSIPTNVRNFYRFSTSPQRFASAVGIALRKS